MNVYMQEQCRALQFQGKKVNGFDVNQLPTGSILQQPLTTLNEMEATAFENNQSLQNTGGGAENIACEGEDESFHAGIHVDAVSLSEVHQDWEIDPSAQPAQSEDPTVSQLLCNEHLNGDPLVQVCIVLSLINCCEKACLILAVTWTSGY